MKGDDESRKRVHKTNKHTNPPICLQKTNENRLGALIIINDKHIKTH